jgi:hypothetical protein
VSIIEDIYQGNWYPAEQIMPSGEQYRRQKQLACAIFDHLNGQLSKSQQKLLDDYLGAAADAEGYVYMEYFRQGVLFGAHLQRELDQAGGCL